MLDDDKFQYAVIGLLIVCLIISYMGIQYQTNMTKTIKDVSKTQCNGIVDMIYEQCGEEQNINITTIKGRNTTLSYDHGVCVIK